MIWEKSSMPALKLIEYYQVKVLVVQLCPTLCDPMDYSLPDSSVHRILQARILEWVAIPFSRRSSWPRHGTQVSHIAGRFLLSEPPGKTNRILLVQLLKSGIVRCQSNASWVSRTLLMWLQPQTTGNLAFSSTQHFHLWWNEGGDIHPSNA